MVAVSPTPPSPSIPIRVRIGLALFGIVVGALLIEVVLWFVPLRPRGTSFESLSDLRAAMLEPASDASTPDGVKEFSFRELITPHHSDKMLYDLRPNLSGRFQRANLQTNRCGMRDDEFPIEKTPGTYRIALLGDSFAFGWGVKAEESFGKVMERELNRLSAVYDSAVRRFEVLNFGVPGYSTFQEVERFKELAIEFDPDAVLVFWVENDFGLPFFVRDLEQPHKLLPTPRLLEQARRMIGSKWAAEQTRLEQQDPNRALQELANIAADRGIKVYFAPNPKQQWREDRKRLWILSERPDIQVLNMRSAMNRIIEVRGIDKTTLTLSFDPHPSPLKHELMGQLLASYFMEVL